MIPGRPKLYVDTTPLISIYSRRSRLSYNFFTERKGGSSMLKRLKGFTLIELLIVVAIIAILAAIAVPNFLEAQTRSKTSRVKADQRSLATALEAYYIDNNSYPAVATSDAGSGNYGSNELPLASAGLRAMPSLRRKANNADQLHTLTTPVSFITSIFTDPFADTRGGTFSYSTNGPFKSGWLVWSFGPDTDEASSSDMLLTGTPENYVEDTVYNPSNTVPSELLVGLTYDPTNGTTSEGDVWRIKQ
jgi:prepilin-type N-terminal cleavage/methylation domain-containing protein